MKRTILFVEEMVMVDKNGDVQGAWDAAIRSGTIPEGQNVPSQGSRPALPCDEDITYEFDQTLRRGDGYIPSMQGNPLKNLVETTCTVQDASGEFVITRGHFGASADLCKTTQCKGCNLLPSIEPPRLLLKFLLYVMRLEH